MLTCFLERPGTSRESDELPLVAPKAKRPARTTTPSKNQVQDPQTSNSWFGLDDVEIEILYCLTRDEENQKLIPSCLFSRNLWAL